VLVLIIAGAVLTLGGIRELARVLGLRRNGLRAEGIVVGHEEESSTRTIAFYPVVRFTTADGRAIEFTSRLSLPIVMEVGKRVPVRYHRDNPERAVIDTFVRTWAMPVTVLLAGLTAFTFGILKR
jgi:hypothetical protein